MPLFIWLVFKALKAIWHQGECEICCPYRFVKVSLHFLTESEMLVIKPKDVSFPGLPLTRKSDAKRASDLVALELQQKLLFFGAALKHKGWREPCAPQGNHILGCCQFTFAWEPHVGWKIPPQRRLFWLQIWNAKPVRKGNSDFSLTFWLQQAPEHQTWDQTLRLKLMEQFKTSFAASSCATWLFISLLLVF